MLTCEICGEQILLEEDMKTHLLLSHLENDLHCPFCFLSGVSYDELCFHISVAHPEEQQDPAHFTSTSSCSAETDTNLTENEVLSCPKCTLICSSNFILQEHIALHLQEQLSAKGEKRLECPICSVICLDRSSLQEHVELHSDYWATLNSTDSLGSDLKLARQLQQEVKEEQRRRLEKANREREEFSKLQSQFGLDGRGGYFRQMERTMEKAVARGLMAPLEFHSQRAKIMESLASGIDDGITRTHGVVRALYEYYLTECRDAAHVWLSAETDHYSSSAGDKDWGCGYRNFQMLLSSLHKIDMYASLLQERAIPNVPHVQRMIESAWKEGLDPQGASHFNQRLQGTTAWIGATEIFTLLTYLGIRS